MAGVVHPTNTLGVSMVGVMMGVMVWGWVVGIRGSIAGGRMVGYVFGLVGVVCTMGEIWFAPRTFRRGPITGFRGSITGFRSSIARSGVRGMVRFGFMVGWSRWGIGCRGMVRFNFW